MADKNYTNEHAKNNKNEKYKKKSSILEKVGERILYHAGEFFYDEPAFFREKSQYDTLSEDKKKYIDAYVTNTKSKMTKEKDWLYKKPGKINFPINEKQKKHNEVWLKKKLGVTEGKKTR